MFFKLLTCSKFDSLQPVVFVGENHFSSPILPLPLQRWYQHCAENDVSVEPLRTELKLLTEEEATDTLSSMGVETMADPDWLLTTDDLAFLRAEGWIIASHGRAMKTYGIALA